MKLALGTAQFGSHYGIANTTGCATLEEIRAIVVGARGLGMDTLDTAVAYGDSERRLGEIGVNAWRVVTKLPALPESVEDVGAWVRGQVEGSLRRLRVAAAHAVLLHRPMQLLGVGGVQLFAALQGVRDAGLARKIGISIYDPEELDALTPRFEFDIVQAPLNVVDQRLIDTGWAARLRNAGTELHVRSVFLQGLLFMGSANRPAKFDRWASIWEAWERWLADTGVSPVEACLSYVAGRAEVDRVVVGIDTLRQLSEIARSVVPDLPPLPGALKSTDPDLVNPGRWAALAN